MKKDLVTIGIPVYNVEKYIEKSLLSALNQTYDNIEYILVDDKGSDNSMMIARNVIANHPRGKDVKIIEHPENIGTGAARNSAISAATGKYIFFMDSDDEISPDCIEKLYEKMQMEEVDFVIGSYQKRLRTREIIENFINNGPCIRGHLEVAWQFFEKRNKSIPVFLWNNLLKISLLRDNQIYCIPSHVIDDNVFSFQLLLNASSCSFNPDVTYFYYDTPHSTMNQCQGENVSYRFCVQFTEIISFYWDYARKFRQEKIYESLLSYIIFYVFYLTDKIRISKAITSKEKKDFLKKITVFPLSLKEILNLKRKKFFFLLSGIIYKMPFKTLIFKFILELSKIKKKLLTH